MSYRCAKCNRQKNDNGVLHQAKKICKKCNSELKGGAKIKKSCRITKKLDDFIEANHEGSFQKFIDSLGEGV